MEQTSEHYVFHCVYLTIAHFAFVYLGKYLKLYSTQWYEIEICIFNM